MGIFSVPAGKKAGTSPDDSVRSGDKELFYRITYSKKRKSLAIVLHRPDEIEVKAPYGFPRSSIRTMVLAKLPWIMRKLASFAREGPRTVQREYEDGELFHYLGHSISLDIISEGKGPLGWNPGCVHGAEDSDKKNSLGVRPRVALCGATLTVVVPGTISEQATRDYVKKKVISWYRDMAITILEERVRFFSSVLAIPVPGFRVRNIRRRWGSCSADNHLSFNTRLVMAPKDEIDYVVLHEMCHIFHKDHQARFWAAVRIHMPDYKERRSRLRQEGWQYVL